MQSSLVLVLLLCGLGIRADDSCTPTDCENCPPGWKPFEGRCYVFLKGEAEWAVAERHCNFLGGNLASISSKKQHDFLREMIFKDTGTNKRTWVGANDAVKEGGWLWSDGTKFDKTYSFWAPGEPDNRGGNQNCMEINMNGTNFTEGLFLVLFLLPAAQI
ncbi:galactose-specific lectin nattectin isoform X2 [Austrofundulus limnaeus]|nr:PREDICTED: galactose-specific lectin nattectin-like isoform X2 [Austrofundulus limnaeus]XP_013880208.1 PREDICTED: galactose-specific lectin nattectin-like isoform X2 [Austrofundulus limnaeus]